MQKGVRDLLLCGKNRLQTDTHIISPLKMYGEGFPGGAVVENPPANAGDTGSSPGPGRSHIKKKKKNV